jgi:hypothetical protein
LDNRREDGQKEDDEDALEEDDEDAMEKDDEDAMEEDGEVAREEDDEGAREEDDEGAREEDDEGAREEEDDDDDTDAEMTPAQEDLNPFPAEAAAAAAFAGRRPPSVVRRENQRFVSTTFNRADVAAAPEGQDRTGGGSLMCRMCGWRVQRGGNPVLSTLLRHAVTSTCLLRRVVLGVGVVLGGGGASRGVSSSEGAMVPPASSPAAARRVKALSHFTGRDPGVIAAIRSVRGKYYAGSSGAGGSAAAQPCCWTCRNCTAQVLARNGSQRLFQHVVVCIGVVPLVQSLTAALWEFAARSSRCLALSYLEDKRTRSPQDSATLFSVPSREPSEEENAAIAPSRSAPAILPGISTRDGTVLHDSGVSPAPVEPSPAGHTLDDPTPQQEDSMKHLVTARHVPARRGCNNGSGPIEPTPAGGSPDGIENLAPAQSSGASSPIHHLHHRKVFEENRDFVASNFGPADPSDVRTCMICNTPVRCRYCSISLKHILSLPCLVRRAERVAFREDPGSTGPSTNPGKRCSEKLLRHASAALGDYCAREFDSTAAGEGTRIRRSCRHCNWFFVGSNTNILLSHVATCTGIVPLVRDLEKISRTFIQSCMRRQDAAAELPPQDLQPQGSEERSDGAGGIVRVVGRRRVTASAEDRPPSRRACESSTETVLRAHGEWCPLYMGAVPSP